MKKKIIGLISLLCLCVACFSLFACGGDPTPTPKTFRVTTEYDSTKGTVSFTPEKAEGYAENDEITITATAIDGYFVKSVKANDVDLTERVNQYKTNIKADTVIKVDFAPIEYVINYNLEGGENGENNPEFYTIESETITLADASKGGTIFLGWTTAGVTEPTKNLTIEKGSTGEKAFTANYEYISYTITYILNGGENSHENPTGYTSKTITFTLKNATKEGYDFINWTDEDGNEVKKVIRGSFGDLVLTANFELHKYKITYDMGGGTSTNPKEYTVEDEFTLEPAEKAGFTFLYWIDENGNRVEGISLGSKGDRKFTAAWQATQTVNVYNDANFTANGIVLDFVQGEEVVYSREVNANKIYIDEFATGVYDIKANISGYYFTLESNVTLKGGEYDLKFDNIFAGGSDVRAYTSNGYAYIDLANGTYSKIVEDNLYIDMRLNVEITESFYAAIYFKGEVPERMRTNNSDIRYGINMYNEPVAQGSGQIGITMYKHNSNTAGNFGVQQVVGKEGSWTTFVSGLSFDVLADEGYWLIACVDKVNNIHSVYVSDSNGTYLVPGTNTSSHDIIGNTTKSIGISYWKIENEDVGFITNATHFRIASSLEDLIVTSDEISVSVNNPDHATVTLNKTNYNKGDKVILTVIPEGGYFLDSITINGDPISYEYVGNNIVVGIILNDILIDVTIQRAREDIILSIADTAVTSKEWITLYDMEETGNVRNGLTYQALMEVSDEAALSSDTLKWAGSVRFTAANGKHFIAQLVFWGSGHYAKVVDGGSNGEWNFKGSTNYEGAFQANKGLRFDVSYSALTGLATMNISYIGTGGTGTGQILSAVQTNLANNKIVKIDAIIDDISSSGYTATLKKQALILTDNNVVAVDMDTDNNLDTDTWADISYHKQKFSAENNIIHYVTTMNLDEDFNRIVASGQEYCIETRVGGRADKVDVFQIGNWRGTLYIKMKHTASRATGIDFATGAVEGGTLTPKKAEYTQLLEDWITNKQAIKLEYVYWKNTQDYAEGEQFRCSLYVYDSLGNKITVKENVSSFQNSATDLAKANMLDYSQLHKIAGTVLDTNVTFTNSHAYWFVERNPYNG